MVIWLILGVALAANVGANDLIVDYPLFGPKIDMSSFTEGTQDYFEAGL